MIITIETLNDATQFATVYSGELPVATAVRRRVFERGPAWRVYDTEGNFMGRVWRSQDYAWLEQRIVSIVKADLSEARLAALLGDDA